MTKIEASITTPSLEQNLKLGNTTITTKDNKNILNMRDIENGLMYFKTLQANNKIGRAQKRAALESLVQLPYMSHQYVRKASPYSHYYDKQAADISSTGQRLAESTSDIDRGFGARLAAEKEALGIREKGMQMDQQNNQRLEDQQRSINQQVDLTNLNTKAKNIMARANVASMLHKIDANKEMANNAAFTNLVHGVDNNILYKKRENAKEKYFGLLENNDYSTYIDKLQSLEDNYKTSLDKFNSLNNDAATITRKLEDQQFYKDYIKNKKY
jgi:hypothetical protein